MSEDRQSLVRELARLAERVDRLEARTAEAAAGDSAPLVTDERDRFWALTALQSRLADHPTTADGSVLIVGSLTLPDGAPVAWQQSIGTAGMLETDWSDLAAALGALGHPVRLELLRQILSGVHTTAELAQVDSLGTSGQLHHHLRQLVSAGWVRQSGRGTYEVPAARVVPLLACLVAGQR